MTALDRKKIYLFPIQDNRKLKYYLETAPAAEIISINSLVIAA